MVTKAAAALERCSYVCILIQETAVWPQKEIGGVFFLCFRLLKLLRGTYGKEAVTRTTKGDQISVKLDSNTALIDLTNLVSYTVERIRKITNHFLRTYQPIRINPTTRSRVDRGLSNLLIGSGVSG